MSDSSILDVTTLNESRSNVKCVATMQELVAESRSIYIVAIGKISMYHLVSLIQYKESKILELQVDNSLDVIPFF